MAVLVKMNMRDGFKGGMESEETIQVAKRLLELGRSWIGVEWWFCQQSADVCDERGHADSFDGLLYELLVAEIRSPMFGKWMIPTVPFKEAYFLEDALKFREALPDAPLIYVGGLVSSSEN